MNFIIENWYIIFVAIALIIIAIVAFTKFFKSNTEKQLTKIKEWLLYATTLAEKELGGGTGKLKLRYVYDMFAAKFPWLVKIVSFERFSELVDTVLVDMNELLATNSAVKQYVDNSNGEVNE
mgnify:CR=1 FL=1